MADARTANRTPDRPQTSMIMKELTAQELDIKVAEIDGWKNVYLYEDNAGPSMLVGDPPPHHPERLGRPDRHLPNFCFDRNAIIEAVLRLPPRKQEKWAVELSWMRPNCEAGWHLGDALFCATAPAIDLARAFVAVNSEEGK